MFLVRDHVGLVGLPAMQRCRVSSQLEIQHQVRMRMTDFGISRVGIDCPWHGQVISIVLRQVLTSSASAIVALSSRGGWREHYGFMFVKDGTAKSLSNSPKDTRQGKLNRGVSTLTRPMKTSTKSSGHAKAPAGFGELSEKMPVAGTKTAS